MKLFLPFRFVRAAMLSSAMLALTAAAATAQQPTVRLVDPGRAPLGQTRVSPQAGSRVPPQAAPARKSTAKPRAAAGLAEIRELSWREVNYPRALGPDDVPRKLKGKYKVSLCIRSGHAWIRFFNLRTGETHTAGRYGGGSGGRFDTATGQKLWPSAENSGIHWDMELKQELFIRAGKFKLISVYVTDPEIFRGEAGGYGHYLVRNNCATYARDAWKYYSGEFYDLGVVHLPADLRSAVLKRHPDIASRATRKTPNAAVQPAAHLSRSPALQSDYR